MAALVLLVIDIGVHEYHNKTDGVIMRRNEPSRL